MTARRLDPIHPGEVLEEEFMRPFGLSANGVAKRLDVPVTRVSEIVRGNRGITGDTALRLARFFGTSPELWLGLQAEYDLRVARREVGESVERRVVPLKRSALTYEGPASGVSEVRELTATYGKRGGGLRIYDRRRIRRRP